MRRSTRQAKTFVGIKEVSSNLQRSKAKVKQKSDIQENDAESDVKMPPAKRIKVLQNTTTVGAKTDSFFSNTSNNKQQADTPIDVTISTNGTKKILLNEAEDYVEKNSYQQGVLSLNKSNSMVLHSHSKENENVGESLTPESDQDELQHYLQMRELNIKANEDFFNSIGINQAKELLQLPSTKKKAQPSKRGLQMVKEPQEPLPSRHSLRIRRIDPVGKPLPEPDPVVSAEEESRLPAGPISMKDCAFSKTDDISPQNVKSMSSLICSQKPVLSPASVKDNDFLSALRKVTMTETRVAKVVPGRVFSLCWHPSPQSLVCVAGDKYGHIGLWDVTTSETGGQDIVRAFKPHTKPVSDLFIQPADPGKLYSCSYDSTLRCGDFEKEVFHEVFSVPEINDDLFRNISFIDSAHTMLVSQFSGNISLVDTRTPTISAEQVYPVSKKSLRTVSVHPVQTHYFITAGIDATIALWDLRSISPKSPKPVQKLENHIKAISSAYFSPTGHKILSSSSDDTFLIYSTGDGMKLDLTKRIRHNNFTGRWLTKFQPIWHPTVENVFVSGSMHRPRQIEVFDADGNVLRALSSEDFLGSVCSLNAFHPNKVCTLVGANSSGRLHIFM